MPARPRPGVVSTRREQWGTVPGISPPGRPDKGQFRRPPPAHGRSTRGGTGLFSGQSGCTASLAAYWTGPHEPDRRLRHCDVVSERVAYCGATPSRRIDLVEVGLEVH